MVFSFSQLYSFNDLDPIAEVFEDTNGVSLSEIQLYLDELDTKWIEQYNNFDYVVIAGGKWFLKTPVFDENNTVQGCHYCPGKNLMELGFDYAYGKAVQLVLSFVTGSDHRAFVFFRTTTPDHFENGEWFSWGACNRAIPVKEGEDEIGDVDSLIRNIEFDEFERATAKGAENGVILKLLDTTRLSLLRPLDTQDHTGNTIHLQKIRMPKFRMIVYIGACLGH